MMIHMAVFLILSAEPAKENATMKALVKDALVNGSEGKSRGPDVSKMPFTPDSIKAVIAASQPLIQGCYEEQLALKKKATEGSIKTAFVITGEGLVTKARIDKKGSSLKQPALHDCVVAVLSSMEFPKPPDGQEHPIEMPFNLKAVH